MSVLGGEINTTGIIQRVTNIILKPSSEWDVIDGEQATPRSIMVGYLAVVAAIPPVASIIGALASGVMGLIWTIVASIVSYVGELAVIYAMSLVVDALAPSFGAQKNPIQSLKWVAYSATTMLVFGVVGVLGVLKIVPFLAVLVGFIVVIAAIAAACYSAYVLYLGAKVTKVPADKAIGFSAVTIVIWIVMKAVLAGVVGVILGLAAISAAASAIHASGPGTINVGGRTVNVGQLEAAANQMAAAGKAAESGKGVPAIDPERLKALMPESVSGLPRTEISTASAGTSGFNGSNAEAVYSNDTSRIRLTVTDLAGAQGLAAFAGAMNVNSSKETATGYERVSTVNGRMTTEEWDRDSKNGKYGVVVANRFAVEASGNAGSIDDLKAAVNAVGPDRLEGLAHS